MKIVFGVAGRGGVSTRRKAISLRAKEEAARRESDRRVPAAAASVAQDHPIANEDFTIGAVDSGSGTLHIAG